jgi:hypothetical protein
MGEGYPRLLMGGGIDWGGGGGRWGVGCTWLLGQRGAADLRGFTWLLVEEVQGSLCGWGGEGVKRSPGH